MYEEGYPFLRMLALTNVMISKNEKRFLNKNLLPPVLLLYEDDYGSIICDELKT